MKSHKKLKVKPGKWFVKVRSSYLPVTWQGWLTYVPYVLILGYLILPYALWPLMCNDVDPCVSVASQWLVILSNIVEVAIVVAVMTWIAKKKS